MLPPHFPDSPCPNPTTTNNPDIPASHYSATEAPPTLTTHTPSNHRPFLNLGNMYLSYTSNTIPHQLPSPDTLLSLLASATVSAHLDTTRFSTGAASASASFTAHNSMLIISVTSRVCLRTHQPGLQFQGPRSPPTELRKYNSLTVHFNHPPLFPDYNYIFTPYTIHNSDIPLQALIVRPPAADHTSTVLRLILILYGVATCQFSTSTHNGPEYPTSKKPDLHRRYQISRTHWNRRPSKG